MTPPPPPQITEVRKPNVGEAKPAAVTADVVVDTRACRNDVRREWDELKQHDVMFLLTVGRRGREGLAGIPLAVV